MRERIPQRIDYHRYTEQGVLLEGVISLAESGKDFPRFNDAIIENSGDISYRLAFDTDILGNRFVAGSIEALVILQCQRCMANFTLDLNCNLSIAFVQNDLQQQLAEKSSYDIFWLAKKELFDPRVLIEDELLLALPQIAKHPESEIGKACDVRVNFFLLDEKLDERENLEGSEQEIKESGQNDKDNPFAVLKQLKNKSE